MPHLLLIHALMSTRPTWLTRLKNGCPTPESLAQQPWLKPVAHLIFKPPLWRMQCEGVARGVAIGVFWAFVIPIGQTIFAVIHCTWWKGNIPTAGLMTMLTNPLTFGFWLWLAHTLGSTILGTPPLALDANNWLDALGDASGPIVLGMLMFAIGGGALGYALVKLVWRWRIQWRQFTRRKAAKIQCS